MKKIVFFLLILLVSVFSRKSRWKSKPSKNPPKVETQNSVSKGGCPLANYTFNVLSLSWPAKFCAQNICLIDWQQLWQGNVATIHGFWLSWKKQQEQKLYCDENWMQGDRACMQGAYLGNVNILDIEEIFKEDPKLIADIKARWPSLKNKVKRRRPRGPNWFYANQWTKHGTCYLKNLIQDNYKDYIANPAQFNATILKEYFSSTIDKVKSLNIVLEPGKVYSSKSDFARDIGFEGKQKHFYVNCGDQQISQILICYSRTPKPGQEITIQCPRTRKACKPPFSVRNYDDGDDDDQNDL